MSRRGAALLFGALLALGVPPALAQEAEAPALRFDPFSGPDLERRASQKSYRSDESEWKPVLKAVLFSNQGAMANLGGVILGVGEQTHGYELLEVRTREAVFRRDGAKVVLRVDPDGESDS